MNIGFIGTGLMGLPMAERVVHVGHRVTVYNRTPAKVDSLRSLGVTIASSPTAVIQASDAIVLMLTNASAIRDTVLAAPATAALPGKTIIQMGTIAPAESRDIHSAVVAAGGDYLEAPVLGSIPEAKAGNLIVMVGATATQLEQWTAVLQCFGPNPVLIGPVGAAATVKLALNQLIGSLTAAFSSSLGFVMAEGVAVEVFMQILRQSALYAPTFDKKLQRMAERNFDNPNFPTKHLLKDIDLFQAEAATLGLNTRLPEAVHDILARAIDLGLADTDYSALFAAVNPEQSPHP